MAWAPRGEIRRARSSSCLLHLAQWLAVLDLAIAVNVFHGRNPSMKIKEQTIPFHVASVGEDEAMAAADVIRSGWLTMGPKTIEFERNFASYVGARHAVGVSSCTAALHLALEAVGLQQGDEVLVPTTTFTATAEVVVYAKAIPVLVDIDPITLCIDPEEARKKVTSRTRAILPVHFAGQPCEMDRIQQLADSHSLHVIEDAAHSLPASFRVRRHPTSVEWHGKLESIELSCFQMMNDRRVRGSAFSRIS